MENLGAKLHQLRTQRELTQRDLARASGLTPSYVSKIESDSLRSAPSTDAVISLARALDADEVELLVAAGRVPSPFEVLGSQPEATRFFRRASQRIRDPEGWDRLTEILESRDFGPPDSEDEVNG